MAFTQDGKHKSSKFRAARYDKEHESKEPKPMEAKGGAGAAAHKMEARGEGNPEQHGFAGAQGMAEHAEENAAPGIHSEIQQVTANHGPANHIVMTHDHDNQRSHVESHHADGHIHHADHGGEGHAMHAHHHAMHATGVTPPEEPEEEQEENEHEPHEGTDAQEGEEEESYAEPL